ncbi:MAG TPA: FAD-linked oxidase C-terminal domain-containing protein, partial [Nitriliruptorales bacterium]
DGSSAVLVLGFESADHPLGPWIERAVELCRDHGGAVTSGPRLHEGDSTGQAEGGAAAWRQLFLQAPYLRDGLVALGAVVETFETAITWDRFEATVERVLAAANGAVRDLCGAGSVTIRTTHAYVDGVAPYVTVVAPGRPGEQVRQWDAVKAAVSEVLLDAGATITHHHAVGRDHVPWYVQQRPDLFGQVLAAAKRTLDPAGVLNPGVLGL